MKKLLGFLLIWVGSLSVHGQILNSGFEINENNQIENWFIKSVEHFNTSCDSTSKHSGSYALKITGSQTTNTDYQPFSQVVKFKTSRLKKIRLSAAIKTENLKGNAALWCQIWDKNNKQVGFQNSEMQNLFIAGTKDWTNYSLLLTVDTNVNKLVIGGYLSGDGIAWFDDFKIEEISEDNEAINKDVKQFSEQITNIIKQNSIYTDSLNWAKIDAHIKQLSVGLKSVDEANIIGDYLIDQLRRAGDNHSFLQSKKLAENYTKRNATPLKPKAELLSNKVGYIFVPGFTTTNDSISKSFTDTIQHLIRTLDTKNKIEGWIVDLRENTGGNMHPMIAGLGPLIGNGTLGYFIKNDKSFTLNNRWFYEDGKVGNGKNITIIKATDPYKVTEENHKIAVLISSKTSSSGEMTAISFIGKKNVKLFGQHSGGYTTGNVSFKLSNGAALVLASSLVADRNQKKYLMGIEPDELIATSNQTDDLTLKAALGWLKK